MGPLPFGTADPRPLGTHPRRGRSFPASDAIDLPGDVAVRRRDPLDDPEPRREAALDAEDPDLGSAEDPLPVRDLFVDKAEVGPQLPDELRAQRLEDLQGAS